MMIQLVPCVARGFNMDAVLMELLEVNPGIIR